MRKLEQPVQPFAFHTAVVLTAVYLTSLLWMRAMEFLWVPVLPISRVELEAEAVAARASRAK